MGLSLARGDGAHNPGGENRSVADPFLREAVPGQLPAFARGYGSELTDPPRTFSNPAGPGHVGISMLPSHQQASGTFPTPSPPTFSSFPVTGRGLGASESLATHSTKAQVRPAGNLLYSPGAFSLCLSLYRLAEGKGRRSLFLPNFPVALPSSHGASQAKPP